MKTQEQRNQEASARTNGAISTQVQRREEHYRTMNAYLTNGSLNHTRTVKRVIR